MRLNCPEDEFLKDAENGIIYEPTFRL